MSIASISSPPETEQNENNKIPFWLVRELKMGMWSDVPHTRINTMASYCHELVDRIAIKRYWKISGHNSKASEAKESVNCLDKFYRNLQRVDNKSLAQITIIADEVLSQVQSC